MLNLNKKNIKIDIVFYYLLYNTKIPIPLIKHFSKTIHSRKKYALLKIFIILMTMKTLLKNIILIYFYYPFTKEN